MQIKRKREVVTTELDTIYRQYRNFMLSIAKFYISDAQVLEDVFQTAFISLIHNQKTISNLSPEKLKTYILLTVRHVSIDYLRKVRSLNEADIPDDVIMELLGKSKDVLSASERPFQTVEFYSVIGQLPVEDQTLLIGKYIVGLDSNELAKLLDCTPGNVRVKLHRANKRALEMFSSLGLSMEDFLR